MPTMVQMQDLTLPYGEGGLLPITEASSWPNAHPQIFL